ncbi:MAG TPA: hypothetical protein VKU19_02265 [Bryobacteraceae bacterium]|nr:hypothetical protein [Bryobacteraceae bacterium]
MIQRSAVRTACLPVLALGFTACLAGPTLAAQTAERPVANAPERLAKWRPVEMPFRFQALPETERQMVLKLVEACQLLDNVFWRQSDLTGLATYRTTRDATVHGLLGIMGGRWDLLDENRPFLGDEPMPPGHELYPRDLTRAKIEDYVRQHPEDRAAIYDPFTVVKWKGQRLTGVKYHEAYAEFLQPMAKALRDAARLSTDRAFANFLNLRAAALLSDDYHASDLAWLDLQDPKYDIIFAPYETYLDDLLGVKTSYGASILVRNEEESRKLSVYQKYVPEIQEALPLDPADRPSKRGHLTPMEVMDAPFRAGDLLHGYQAVADNLPNDPRIHQEKGSKKIFFKNFMDARVDYVILPLARKLMEPSQAAKATAEGYLAGTLLHEIAHELGPAFARVNGKQVDINEAIGPAYSGLEEAKADVTGMFGLAWMVEHDALPKARLEEYYASYVADLFRTLRFGAGEAHGRAETMEFNYLLENRAIEAAGDLHTSGRYRIDYGRMPAVMAALARELLQMEATGDRARVEKWFTRYGTIASSLQDALRITADIPVDIRPLFSFPEKVR